MDAVGSLDRIEVDDYARDWEKPSLFLGAAPNPLEMESIVKKALEDRVVVDLTGNRANYQVDQCLNIQGPTLLECQKVARCWQGMLDTLKLLTKMACSVAAVIAFASPFWRESAVIFGVVWLVIAGIGSLIPSRQIKLWNTPPYQEPAEQRAKAYLETFPLLYANRLQYTPSLRTGVLHPNEVEHLYKKYMADFCRTLLAETPSTSEEKKAWIKKFLKLNPLSPALMQYGFQKIPATFEELGDQYDRLVPVTYGTLLSKFKPLVSPRGQIGLIGRAQWHDSSSYPYKLEGLIVEVEHKLERLKNDYLIQREQLKAEYITYLPQIAPVPSHASPEKLQELKYRFDDDLKRLKGQCIDEMELIKKNYLENQQHLKTQLSIEPGPQEMEDRLERRWDALKTILIEKTRNRSEIKYEDARNLLEAGLSRCS